MIVSANIPPKYFSHKLNSIECRPCKNVWVRPSWPTVNIIQKRQIDFYTLYVSFESPQHFHVTCLSFLSFLCFSYQTLKVIWGHFFHLCLSMYCIIRAPTFNFEEKSLQILHIVMQITIQMLRIENAKYFRHHICQINHTIHCMVTVIASLLC